MYITGPSKVLFFLRYIGKKISRFNAAVRESPHNLCNVRDSLAIMEIRGLLSCCIKTLAFLNARERRVRIVARARDFNGFS